MALTVYVEEKKAGEKWCPMARVLDTLIGRESADQPDHTIAVGASNRGYQMGGALHSCMCIGARCMMWRWARTHISPPGGGDMEPSENTHGYCGLAGYPNQTPSP